MANQSTGGDKRIDRRTGLQVGTALAATGLLHGRHAEAQQRQPIIDCQVHAYAANTPERPWKIVPNWPAHVTGDEMVAAMDKVGVDGAIDVSRFSTYEYDGSYAVSVQKAHPNRFALVKPVNPYDPAVADVVAEWKKTPGTVGIRIIMTKEANSNAGRSWPRPDLTGGCSAQFSGEHFFLGQHRCGTHYPPPSRCALRRRPYGYPPTERATGPPAALGRSSKSGGTRQTQECGDQDQRRLHTVKGTIPVPDIWDPLARIFDAWGFDRCLWGTDWTRAFAVVNYEQAVEPFLKTDRLSAIKATLTGGPPRTRTAVTEESLGPADRHYTSGLTLDDLAGKQPELFGGRGYDEISAGTP